MIRIICNKFCNKGISNHKIINPSRILSFHKSTSTSGNQRDEIRLKFESKVPLKSVNNKLPDRLIRNKIDEATVNLLEQLSLVECANENGIKTLQDAIEFADGILHIKTDHVQPMYTVLENRCLSLRSDEITEGFMRKEIVKNAVLIEEDYFVAPPGNIPLATKERSTNNNKEASNLSSNIE